MDAIDFGPSTKIKIASIELLKYMYCLKLYACERDIFKTISPIYLILQVN